MYSRNKDPAGVDGDVRGCPDVELKDCLCDELSGDTEVRSVVLDPTPIEILDDARLLWLGVKGVLWARSMG